jgi:hypothetical protein
MYAARLWMLRWMGHDAGPSMAHGAMAAWDILSAAASKPYQGQPQGRPGRWRVTVDEV